LLEKDMLIEGASKVIAVGMNQRETVTISE
jgi:hypothetical protein